MAMKIEDIARICGYSRSTVSRVLNGDANVNEKTRERILEVIRQYNFQPNLAARRLAAGHTGVLGLVIPLGVNSIFTDPFFGLLIQGVSTACNEVDYSVMLWLAEPEYKRRTLTRILYNGLIDGAIVASSLLDDPIVNALSRSSLPYLLVGRPPGKPEVSFVDVDNRDGAYRAVLHLLDLGRKRVATITGPVNMIAGIDRLEGYKAALQDHGHPVLQDLIVEGDFTEEGGYAAMQCLLAARPDAVFVASDAMAFGALRALSDAGLRVPQDIAVVGFDDVTPPYRPASGLTTIRQAITQVGITAARTLIELIQKPSSEPRHIILPTELIVRETCGAHQ